jgi:hypothetical protein
MRITTQPEPNQTSNIIIILRVLHFGTGRTSNECLPCDASRTISSLGVFGARGTHVLVDNNCACWYNPRRVKWRKQMVVRHGAKCVTATRMLPATKRPVGGGGRRSIKNGSPRNDMPQQRNQLLRISQHGKPVRKLKQS